MKDEIVRCFKSTVKPKLKSKDKKVKKDKRKDEAKLCKDKQSKDIKAAAAAEADEKDNKRRWRNIEEMDQYLHYIGGGAGALALTGVAAASAFYLASRPTADRTLVPLDRQSEILKEDDDENSPDLIRVSKFHKESREGKFLKHIYDDGKTLYETFRRGVNQSNNGPCLGWRETATKPYQWVTYNEALLRAMNLGSGLCELGLQPGNKTLVGIYAQNSPEWIITEQALFCHNMVAVPLYDTLGPDACAYIIDQTEMSTVFCEDDKKCNLLLDRVQRCLKRIICYKELRPATRERARKNHIETILIQEVELMGSKKPHQETPPRPEDLCTICYTSGTTGAPKGVMLTHENVIAAVCAVCLQLGDYTPNSSDVMLSFLPLAHMLERCCEHALFMVGGCVGYFFGDIRKLGDDMKALKPTVTPAVPRILNRIYDHVYTEISGSFIKRTLFNMALSAKESEIKKGIVRKNSIWDKIVFKKIQDNMGGRLKLMIVGSAPLAGPVLTFARCALGCLIVEGYGQTEATAPITLTVQGDHVPEHVGPPVPCCAVKLVDVPEMEYYTRDHKGEVCVKGNNVTKGYYKEPQKTREIIDDQGWLHTGDIGMWMPNGTLKIIDRKKHIFKLSQGEYIVPEKIENAYIRSRYIEQVFVYGESLKSSVVAIVVPAVEEVKNWARQNNIEGTLSVLCNNPEIKKLILDDMVYWGKEEGLKSFEQVKDIYLHPDPFSVNNGLLTPTLKQIRPNVARYFKPQLEDMCHVLK